MSFKYPSIQSVSVVEIDAKNNCSSLVGQLKVGDFKPLVGQLKVAD
jgi:hypothetical protein